MAIQYYCSDGSRITEASIHQKYSVAIRMKHVGQSWFTCQACLSAKAVDNSHIIAKSRLKQLHKTELIWHPNSFFDACRRCHGIWEDYKSGEWILFKNVEQCLKFLKEHDPEGYQKRIEFTRAELIIQAGLDI